jgi:hypothetical protein
MKANPGGTVTGEAIIGREAEIADLWFKLQTRSVVLSAERRVGKTSILRKMWERPQADWTPVLVYVESARHPIECVEAIYGEANRLKIRSSKAVSLARIKTGYSKLAEAQLGGWKLPQVSSTWKAMLKTLVADLAEHSANPVLIMIDEFPLLVSNIADDHGPHLAMEFLDTMREVRQAYEATGKIRFLFSGSIGLHLVLQYLKAEHGYKGSPTNDMAPKVLGGMSPEDTGLMCQRYLDEEGIHRVPPEEVAARMFQSTDGLPLYIQYVCERFQAGGKASVAPDEIDAVLREMLDSRELEWFRNAAQRIDTYYARLGASECAFAILGFLSRSGGMVSEQSIVDHVPSRIVVEHKRVVLDTLELLLDDNYLVRDTSTGERRYRFRYVLMRDWWRVNRA